ncbi:hypothetical protein [Streptomyces tropicalis]|uniref:Alpha/beta hydrolase n=1 Tax=Streptomyces tropicalis TaxID=3034234 RepID=A0ABT6A734_9ACTN|nr:hypothetical protein [Streptomyces tropicalis]MDF3299630.1 hypothetical protein [Streptomyces tropicalis]
MTEPSPISGGYRYVELDCGHMTVFERTPEVDCLVKDFTDGFPCVVRPIHTGYEPPPMPL